MDFIDEKIENYAYEHTQDEGELLAQLEKETYETLEIPHMTTGRIEGQFLKMLVHLLKAKRVLEIGTFGGYASLSMAAALPEDGHLFTCDIDPPAIAFAKRFFSQSEHGKKITLLEGPALESLKTLSGSFDLAFIDADKENYWNYYEAIFPMIVPGGLIVVDNVLWSGRVLSPVDASDKAIHQFNDRVRQDARVEAVMLTVRDGIYCLRKR
ncbi:MAG: class I SAM-dependent methyltransferase [Nitrospinae bacterium]|jgi:caffeoyl-CoA O-methyltransferase|nr:class I SAM-dependent methyltransferase [Nitrospinota bacterium]MDA1110042.1 class I SAM-dependent methyltransferase [Nitrospinota bacterium]